jgi:uncharacterized protein
MRHQRLSKVVLAAFGILLCRSYAQAWAQAPSPAPAKSCLWKVSSIDTSVYLLGSIHLLKGDFYPLPKPMEMAFNNSRRVAFEVNLDETNSREAQQLILNKSQLPQGRRLQDVLSKASFEFVKEKIEPLGLRVELLEHFKPWFLMLTLTVTKLQKLGYDPAHGIDKYFFDKAKKWDREILSLETSEFQISLLDALSPKTQEAALLQTLRELDLMEKEFDEIVRAWSGGDRKALEGALLGSFEDYPDVYEKIVIGRNRNWLPKIEDFLKRKGNTLVIVGAAHLVGASGLIELLEQKGYTLEQQ